MACERGAHAGDRRGIGSMRPILRLQSVLAEACLTRDDAQLG